MLSAPGVSSIPPGVRARPAREQRDGCPGALTLHEAADGALARVRIPGGIAESGGLRALGQIIADLGNGICELTSRGNLQIRGLPLGCGLDVAQRLFDAGLMPSTTHELVRNIIGSPLAGLDGGTDLTSVIRATDAAICGAPTLSELPGRFLIAVDDARADLRDIDADVRVEVDGQRAAVAGLWVDTADAPAAVVALAGAFLAARAAQGSGAWRIEELPTPGAVAQLATRELARRGIAVQGSESPARDSPRNADHLRARARPVGLIAQRDGGCALVVHPPSGRITAAQLGWLADAADARGEARAVRITPWRSVVIPDAGRGADALAGAAALARSAAEHGFGVGPTTPWLRASACAGAPGCAKSLADVHGDLGVAVSAGRLTPDDALEPGPLPVRWSGCARRCGRPNTDYVDVLALGDGRYEVSTIRPDPTGSTL